MGRRIDAWLARLALQSAARQSIAGRPFSRANQRHQRARRRGILDHPAPGRRKSEHPPQPIGDHLLDFGQRRTRLPGQPEHAQSGADEIAEDPRRRRIAGEIAEEARVLPERQRRQDDCVQIGDHLGEVLRLVRRRRRQCVAHLAGSGRGHDRPLLHAFMVIGQPVDEPMAMATEFFRGHAQVLVGRGSSSPSARPRRPARTTPFPIPYPRGRRHHAPTTRGGNRTRAPVTASSRKRSASVSTSISSGVAMPARPDHRHHAADHLSEKLVVWRIGSTLDRRHRHHARPGQARAEERGQKLAAHVSFRRAGVKRAEDPGVDLGEKLRRRLLRGDRHVDFLTRNQPPLPQQTPHSPQQIGGILEVEQNKAADDGVEVLLRFESRQVSDFQRHVTDSKTVGARARHFDRCGGAVDAHDRAGRADDAGGEKGHVADAASEVEHMHAFR